MEPMRQKSKDARPLSSVLGPDCLLPLDEALRVLRGVAAQVHALHRQGRLHRAIDGDHVCLGPDGEPQLRPPPRVRWLGGRDRELDSCPPELADGKAIELSEDIEQARSILAGQDGPLVPQRIDVYQLGTLLCRLLTGSSVLGYLYDADVKGRVPPSVRDVLENALGFDPSRRFASGDELLNALDKLSPPSATAGVPRAASETPPQGSAIFPMSDTAIEGRKRKAFPSEDLPFVHLAHFRILGRLGRGGMGDVYHGYDETLHRQVAIKVLPQELARDEDFVRRFHAEAAAAAKISHPNIIPVHFVGEDAGFHFFAMQYIEGESLAGRLERRGRLDAEEALEIVAQCLSGLGAAHAQGLIHRDVKPGNILLDRSSGRAVVADFGLVRRINRATRMTVTGMIMGTVDYIAPEQARGQPVDGRADLYSLGVVFYEILSGRLPFEADSAAVMIFQHAYEPPFPLEQAARDVPAPIRAIVARMMAKAPERRYADCQEALDDVRASQAGRPLCAQTLREGRGCEQTTILPAPTPSEDLEPPATLEQLAAPRRLLGLRDWAATMFRRHAPEFAKQLRSTTQWADSAVAEYERRDRRLTKVLAEANEIARSLAEQIEDNRRALAEALREIEIAASEDARERALARKKSCEETIETLGRHHDDQKRAIAEIELQLAQTQATLARLRSQREVLQARLKSADVQRNLLSGADGKRGVPGVWLVLGVVAAGLLLVTSLVLAVKNAKSPPVIPSMSDYRTPVPRTLADQTGPGAEESLRPGPSEAEIRGKTITNSIGMSFVLVPAGKFLMGTDRGEVDLLRATVEGYLLFAGETGANETPLHEVTISKPFYLGQYEVTQAEFKAIKISNPSRVSEGMLQEREKAAKAGVACTLDPHSTTTFDSFPVDSVEYDDAVTFCERLSKRPEEVQAGRTYRLPTEAEWEYACRAGTKTQFSLGDDPKPGDFNFGNANGVKVGGCYASNALGLYDMHGNVWEWVADRYDPSYYAVSPRIDPKGPREAKGNQWVLRGGSFADPALACRSAFRGAQHKNGPSHQAGIGSPVGFRVVCEVKGARSSP